MNNTISSSNGFVNEINAMSDEHFNLMQDISCQLNHIAMVFMNSPCEEGGSGEGSVAKCARVASELTLEKMDHNKQSLIALRTLSSELRNIIVGDAGELTNVPAGDALR